MLNRHVRAMAPVLLGSLLAVLALHSQNVQALESEYEFNDAHFHLTNYIQESTPIREFLKIMGNTTGRSVLFGIPLLQQWSYRVSGDNASTYYLHTDAPLYYYSFTDAHVTEVLAVMATAGLYDDSGKWLFATGLPAKSGVGGGIIAVSPGNFGIAVISPPLDAAGNSVRAQKAIADISNPLHGNPYLPETAPPRTN